MIKGPITYLYKKFYYSKDKPFYQVGNKILLIETFLFAIIEQQGIRHATNEEAFNFFTYGTWEADGNEKRNK